MSEELSAQAKWLALQDPIDEVEGLASLLLFGAVGDLVSIKLEIKPANGDGLHG